MERGKNMRAAEILDIAIRAAGLVQVPVDSGVLVDGDNIKKVMFGIDMEGPELIIAKQLGYDCVITHHPKGGDPLVSFAAVMNSQIDRMVQAGIPINKAQKALAERKEEVDRLRQVENYDRAVSAAKLLQMPYIVLHTPTDILAEAIVQEHLDTRFAASPKATLAEVEDALLEIPEYRNALAKPKIRVGSKESFAGLIFATMAGGTSGGKEVFKAYFEAGVGTLVVMHAPDEVLKAVREQNLGNVIVAGHMASDSVGVNSVIKALEANGIEVTRASGVVDPF
jgi:putative NIF3 family GTP cyclohydrolase 1 type 2